MQQKVTGNKLKEVQTVIDALLGKEWRYQTVWGAKKNTDIRMYKLTDQRVINLYYHFFVMSHGIKTKPVRLLKIETAYRGFIELSIFDVLRLKELCCEKPSEDTTDTIIP